MEGVVDVAELKEKIVNTGAEVKAKLLFYSTITTRGNPKARKLFNKQLIQAGLNNCIWADSFAIGVVARWSRHCDDVEDDVDDGVQCDQ